MIIMYLCQIYLICDKFDMRKCNYTINFVYIISSDSLSKEQPAKLEAALLKK